MNDLNSWKNIKSILHNPLDKLEIMIEHHLDPSMISMRGKVINETKYMINMLSHNRGLLSIPKHNGTFMIISENHRISIKGHLLVGTAKSRSKKKLRNW